MWFPDRLWLCYLRKRLAQKTLDHVHRHCQADIWAGHHCVDAYQPTLNIHQRATRVPWSQVQSDVEQLPPRHTHLRRWPHTYDHTGGGRAAQRSPQAAAIFGRALTAWYSRSSFGVCSRVQPWIISCMKGSGRSPPRFPVHDSL